MSVFATLSSDRLRLRRWRDSDRDIFAAMNSDPRVMQFFANCLSRDDSNAMIDRIEEHFAHRGFGLWAVEVPGVAPFIGFAGLSVLTAPPFRTRCTPCIEVGWRLAFEHWGRGYATEAAQLALRYAFEALALSEVVSFTSVVNFRSRAVMKRLGMHRDPADDFDHPTLPEGHPLRKHVLYRLGSSSYLATG
jgi:RimJ/RimL family protein N-acetyltransferase